MGATKRTVLITGGTKGLGLATAEAFAAEGARLILTYRSDEENAKKIEASFLSRSVECHVVGVDFTDDNAPDLLFDSIAGVAKEISVYVHNAAATVFRPLLDVKLHHLQKTFNITVFSLIRNVQRIVPLMPRGGAILTVSGMDTLEAVPFHGVLAAAKASLEMLTQYLGHELAEKGIRVNGVNPGYIPTDSTRKYMGPDFDAANRAAAELTPLHRLADPKDVASVMVFLASDAAQWMVGQTITVDGGWTFASPALRAILGKKERES